MILNWKYLIFTGIPRVRGAGEGTRPSSIQAALKVRGR